MRRLAFVAHVKRVGSWLAAHARLIGKIALVTGLLIVSVLPALVDNTVIGYLPVLVVVWSLVAMFAYFMVLAHSIHFEESLTLLECVRGEAADVSVSVENKSLLLAPRVEARLFISDLNGEMDLCTQECFSLLPHERRELVLSARFDHIGRYQVGLYSLKVTDLFGLFTREYHVEEKHEVVVTPRIAELAQLAITDEQASDATRFRKVIVADGYDYVGMRDYELGDQMKSVHWKASARYERLLTRLRERQVNPSITVVLDRQTLWPEGERMMTMYDAVVESALSVAAYACAHGIECMLACAGADGELMGIGSARSLDVRDVMEAVPRLDRAAAPASACDVVHSVSIGIHASSNIVVCSSNPDEGLLAELVSAHMRKKNVVMMFARPADLERVEANDISRRLSHLSMGHVPCVAFEQANELERCSL